MSFSISAKQPVNFLADHLGVGFGTRMKTPTFRWVYVGVYVPPTCQRPRCGQGRFEGRFSCPLSGMSCHRRGVPRLLFLKMLGYLPTPCGCLEPTTQSHLKWHHRAIFKHLFEPSLTIVAVQSPSPRVDTCVWRYQAAS